MQRLCLACWPTSRIGTLPKADQDGAENAPENDAPDGIQSGASLHWSALERLYRSAPINQTFASKLAITGEGTAQIRFPIDEAVYHAAGAAHGTIYFKMLDDAAFYAANTLVTDRFLLTTSFNMHFSKPVKSGEVVAEGKWVSGRRRVLVAESRLIDAEGEEIGRGTGTFMRSRIPLSTLPGYASSDHPQAD